MGIKEKIGRGAATMGVASLLSVSMLAGQAAPSQAIIPILPIIAGAAGGTAVGAAVSGWALAGYAALTAGVLGVGMAINQNGAVIFKDLTNFLNPEKKAEKQTTNSPPQPSPPGASTGDGMYVWASNQVIVKGGEAFGVRWDKYTFPGTSKLQNRLSVDFTYTGSGTGTQAVRFMYVIESQCRNNRDGTMYSEVRYITSTTMQGASGYRDITVTHGCSDVIKGELIDRKSVV